METVRREGKVEGGEEGRGKEGGEEGRGKKVESERWRK